jgi:hypothetical protein
LKSCRTSEENTKMDLQEIGWGNVDCINLSQYKDKRRALLNTVMNFRGA